MPSGADLARIILKTIQQVAKVTNGTEILAGLIHLPFSNLLQVGFFKTFLCINHFHN